MSAVIALTPRTAARIRPMEEGDWNFVYTTWTNSAACNVPHVVEARHAREVRGGWLAASHVVLNALRPSSRIVVACKADEPGILFGWAATLEGEALYIYVSKMFRGRGIGRALRAWQKEQAE